MFFSRRLLFYICATGFIEKNKLLFPKRFYIPLRRLDYTRIREIRQSFSCLERSSLNRGNYDAEEIVDCFIRENLPYKRTRKMCKISIFAKIPAKVGYFARLRLLIKKANSPRRATKATLPPTSKAIVFLEMPPKDKL